MRVFSIGIRPDEWVDDFELHIINAVPFSFNLWAYTNFNALGITYHRWNNWFYVYFEYYQRQTHQRGVGIRFRLDADLRSLNYRQLQRRGDANRLHLPLGYSGCAQ